MRGTQIECGTRLETRLAHNWRDATHTQDQEPHAIGVPQTSQRIQVPRWLPFARSDEPDGRNQGLTAVMAFLAFMQYMPPRMLRTCGDKGAAKQGGKGASFV